MNPTACGLRKLDAKPADIPTMIFPLIGLGSGKVVMSDDIGTLPGVDETCIRAALAAL